MNSSAPFYSTTLIRTSIILLCLILSGCMQLEKLPSEKIASLKRVGVISVTAHEFHRRYTGVTVFGNESEKLDIRDWKVDEAYEEQIAQAIAKAGPCEPIRTGYNREMFMPVYELNGPWDAPAFRGPNWSRVQEAFKAHARQHKLDAIVFAMRKETGDFFTMGNQILRGAGLYATGAGNNTTVSVLHLFSEVALIDGSTGKPLLTRWLSRTQEPIRGGANIQRAMPYEPVSPNLSRTPVEKWDEEQKALLRKMLIEMPESAWRTTVVSMF